jgi:hypothetical protein
MPPSVQSALGVDDLAGNPSLGQREVLALQRVAGNRAVRAMLSRVVASPRVPADPRAGRRATVTLQRFDTFEHERMGNKGSAFAGVELVPGYRLTYGEMVAMAGDYFESIDEMRAFAAKPGTGKGTRQELEFVRTEKVHKMGLKYPNDVVEAADARYYRLASKNASHFPNAKAGDADKPMADRVAAAPNPMLDISVLGSLRLTPTPRNAIEGYRYYHVRAIVEAVAAGKQAASAAAAAALPAELIKALKAAGGTPPKAASVDAALATEAFGAHYLTDSFASGHLRTERQSIKEYWDTRFPMFFRNLKGFMAEEVARRVAAGMTVGPFQVREDVAYDPPGAEGAMQIVGKKLDAIGPLGLGDLVSGAIHDYDNQHGVLATSGGQDVTLYGDNMAGKGDEESLATKAVGFGASDVQTAFKMGSSGSSAQDAIDALLGPDHLFAVERLIPKAKPDDQQGPDRKKSKWDYATLDALLADPQFAAGARIFAAEKANIIKEVVNTFDAAKKKAVEEGIIKPLVSNPVALVRKVVDWTPSITDSAFGHNTDDRANDYWKDAKRTKGGLASLTFPQRDRLLQQLFKGLTVGDDEDAVMDVLKTAPDADARQLIRKYKWSYIHDQVDDGPGEAFARAFPKATYGP